MTGAGRLVVYGATGSTGGRVAALAAEAGLEPVLAGRRPEALAETAASHRLEARGASLHPRELDGILGDASVLVSCVGPGSLLGPAVAAAAVRAGAHYIDFSGEPVWINRLIAELDGPAQDRGVALVPGVGLGVAADLAAQLAAERVEPVERLVIGYRIAGMRPSGATVRSTVEAIAAGAPVVTGSSVRFVPSGSRRRELPGGTGFIFPSPDALLLARAWPGATAEAYMQYPLPALSGPAFAAAGAVLRRRKGLEAARIGLDRAGRALAQLHGGGGHSVAVAVAEGGGREGVAFGEVEDVYDVTARSAIVAVRALLAGAGAETPGVRSWGEVTGDPRETAREARVALRLA